MIKDHSTLNEALEKWLNDVESPIYATSPESIPLPPQDEKEVLDLMDNSKNIEPKNIPLPPQNKNEIDELSEKDK